MTTISSPCIQVCNIDPATALCTGCGRTVDEIRGWRLLDEDERLRVMDGLAERMRTAEAASLATVED